MKSRSPAPSTGTARRRRAERVSDIVNIHHHFTNGVAWKIRNPAVPGERFAHLARG